MEQGDLVEITALWEPILGCVGILINVDPFHREWAGKPIHHSVLVKGKIWMIKEQHMKVLSVQKWNPVTLSTFIKKVEERRSLGWE